VIGVLVRFLAKQYVASRIYQGSGGPAVAVDPPASAPPPPAATTPDKPDQNGTPTD
jgi:hypothetical protein